MIEITLLNTFLIIFLWIGMQGIADTMLSGFLQKSNKILVYFVVLCLSLIAIYFVNNGFKIKSEIS